MAFQLLGGYNSKSYNFCPNEIFGKKIVSKRQIRKRYKFKIKKIDFENFKALKDP